jgi:hypothetical protein
MYRAARMLGDTMRYDKLYDVDWHLLRHVTFGWIDAIGRIKRASPADVVVAAAINLLLVCERFKLNPRRVMDTADRVVRRARDVAPQYPRAIEQFLNEEFQDNG